MGEAEAMTTGEGKRPMLARAKEADEMVAKVRDIEARETWKKIAQNYRELAKILTK